MGALRRWLGAVVCICGVGFGGACGGTSMKRGAEPASATAGAPSAGSHGGTGGDENASAMGGTIVMAGMSVGGGALAGTGTAPHAGAATAGGNSAGAESAGASGAPTNVSSVPSPACALAKRPARDLGFATYTLPDNYDAVTPLPIIIELQATNVPVNLAAPRDKRAQALAGRYIIVAPRPGNSFGSFESMMKKDFLALIQQALAEVCFDSHLVFAAGNGSGGRVLMGWLASYAATAPAEGAIVPRLRAAAVVGAYSGSYKPATPVIFIHSTSLPDSRAFDDLDGMKALQRFITGNECSDSSTPVEVAGCNSDDTVMDPHCVDFNDCSAALRWCQPDDAASMATADPWPCFANAAIDQFFTPYLD